MQNELILLIALFGLYGSVLLWYRLFGTRGLFAFNVAATILANIEVLLLVRAFGMEMTLGNLLFATTFVITDILSETEGKRQAQQAVYLGIATSLLFVAVTQSWLLYQLSENDWAGESIHTLFAAAPRLILASLVVYAISQALDVWLYHKWWNLTERKCGDRKKMLWLRNNGSTLLSQLVNAVLYNVLAFGGMYDGPTMGQIILSTYVIFVVTSLLDTPVVYLARRMHERRTA